MATDARAPRDGGRAGRPWPDSGSPRNVGIDCQIAEERRDLGGAPLLRVALAMENDEASNPIAIGLLGANAVVAEPDGGASLREQGTGFCRVNQSRYGWVERRLKGRPIAQRNAKAKTPTERHGDAFDDILRFFLATR